LFASGLLRTATVGGFASIRHYASAAEEKITLGEEKKLHLNLAEGFIRKDLKTIGIFYLEKLPAKDKANFADPMHQSSPLKGRFMSGIKEDEIKSHSDAVRLMLSLANASQREVFKSEIQQTIAEYKRKENDTGSCEVQGMGSVILVKDFFMSHGDFSLFVFLSLFSRGLQQDYLAFDRAHEAASEGFQHSA